MQKNIIQPGRVLNIKNESKYLHHYTLIAVLLLVLVFALSCNKEPEYIPGQTVQGIRAPISKVLFSPIAYDGAVLKLEGTVVGLVVEGQLDEPIHESQEPTSATKEEVTEELEDPTTLFKLMDTKGNYINIIMPGTWEFVEDDYLVVGGIYRKDDNELHAYEFEIVEFEEDSREAEIESRDDW